MKNFKVARTNMTIRGEGGIRLDSWNLSPEASERLVVVFNQFYTYFIPNQQHFLMKIPV